MVRVLNWDLFFKMVETRILPEFKYSFRVSLFNIYIEYIWGIIYTNRSNEMRHKVEIILKQRVRSIVYIADIPLFPIKMRKMTQTNEISVGYIILI